MDAILQGPFDTDICYGLHLGSMYFQPLQTTPAARRLLTCWRGETTQAFLPVTSIAGPGSSRYWRRAEHNFRAVTCLPVPVEGSTGPHLNFLTCYRPTADLAKFPHLRHPNAELRYGVPLSGCYDVPTPTLVRRLERITFDVTV